MFCHKNLKLTDSLKIKEPIGMYGAKIRVQFSCCCGASFIDKEWQMYSKFRIELSGLTLEPLASADAKSQEEKRSWCCTIDIGGGTTDLAIFKDGIICLIQR
jgi:cell division protein FtsA